MHSSNTSATGKGVKGAVTPAELVQQLTACGVSVRATKRGLVVHGPVRAIPVGLWARVRAHEAALVEYLRNPSADRAIAELQALKSYRPRAQSAANGPLEADERRAVFEVRFDDGRTRLVEVKRSAAGRQYTNVLLPDGHVLRQRFMGADLLPLPEGRHRRLDDTDTAGIYDRLWRTCERCGAPTRGRVCSERLVYQREDALDTAAELIRRTIVNRGPLRWAEIVAELANQDNPCAVEAVRALLLAARRTAGVVFARGGGRGSGAGAGVWMLADPPTGDDLDAELARLLDEGSSS